MPKSTAHHMRVRKKRSVVEDSGIKKMGEIEVAYQAYSIQIQWKKISIYIIAISYYIFMFDMKYALIDI